MTTPRPQVLSHCIQDWTAPPYRIDRQITPEGDLTTMLRQMVHRMLVDGASADINEHQCACDFLEHAPKGYGGVDGLVSDIVHDLLRDGYYVWNRWEKYWSVAFALDYARFEVYAKDIDKELIKWRENDGEDPVYHQVRGDYNANPVFAAVAAAQAVLAAPRA